MVDQEEGILNDSIAIVVLNFQLLDYVAVDLDSPFQRRFSQVLPKKPVHPHFLCHRVSGVFVFSLSILMDYRSSSEGDHDCQR